MWRQELDLGGSAPIGLKGWQGATLSFNNPAIATYTSFVDRVNDLLGIDVVGLKPGDAEFCASRGGALVASMQINVSTTPTPNAYYVDHFDSVYYDIDYMHDGNPSKYLILHCRDDVALAIHMDRIFDSQIDPLKARSMIDNAIMGEGARRYPLVMNATTTPNLVAAKRRAIEAIYGNLYDIMVVSKEAIILVLTIYEVARGLLQAAFEQMARASAPRSVRQVLEPGAGAGSQFNKIPFGQTAESLGRNIGLRVGESAYTAGRLGQSPSVSWINRVLAAVRPLRLSPSDSAEVIESATRSAGYSHGVRAALEDGTMVVTSARTGANQFVVGIRPNGEIVRGMATIRTGPEIPGGVEVTDVDWAP